MHHDQVASRALEAALQKYKHSSSDLYTQATHTIHPRCIHITQYKYEKILSQGLLFPQDVCVRHWQTWEFALSCTSLEPSCVSATCASVSDSAGVTCPVPSIRGFSPSSSSMALRSSASETQVRLFCNAPHAILHPKTHTHHTHTHTTCTNTQTLSFKHVYEMRVRCLRLRLNGVSDTGVTD